MKLSELWGAAAQRCREDGNGVGRRALTLGSPRFDQVLQVDQRDWVRGQGSHDRSGERCPVGDLINAHVLLVADQENFPPATLQP